MIAHRLVSGHLFGFIVLAICTLSAVEHEAHAQTAPIHLNPVVAKLVEGKVVYGLITGDLSIASAHAASRARRPMIW